MAYPRSPNDQKGGLVYFPRMLDKMHLHLKGKLTEDYHRMRGKGFDAACCDFLGVNYDDVLKQVQSNKEDAEICGKLVLIASLMCTLYNLG